MIPLTTQTIGFVGTGTITSAIVTGLCTDDDLASPIIVSPRNASIAEALAQRFARVQVARSNQDVLDRSQVIFLAVRPQVASDVLDKLRFRADHHVVSLIATYSRDLVATLVAPSTRITCAVPQPTVAARMGPTVQCPPDPVVRSLFEKLGTVFEVASEAEFRTLFASTAVMAAYFAWLDTIATWLVARGIAAGVARRYVATMFQGLAGVPGTSPKTFADLAHEFKTRGGLNEQFERHLGERHVFGAGETGLDAIADRLDQGAALVATDAARSFNPVQRSDV